MFSVDELGSEGFRGFVPLSDVGAEAPSDRGVYVILREPTALPRFIERSPVGHPDGRDMSISVATLASHWVECCSILYIGKATSLRKRLGQYRRAGSGGKSHRGGRSIWQLDDANALVACWRRTPDEVPRDVEKKMLQRFKRRYGCLPFANAYE